MKPVFTILCALLATAVPVFAADAPRYNVLLIMADDLRDFGGAFTKEVVKTPNLDRLRARGTTFEAIYVTSFFNAANNVVVGGVGASGYGREMGFDAMREYTQVKSIWVNVDAQLAPHYLR